MFWPFSCFSRQPVFASRLVCLFEKSQNLPDFYFTSDIPHVIRRRRRVAEKKTAQRGPDFLCKGWELGESGGRG
jgi:hypothetical protein